MRFPDKCFAGRVIIRHDVLGGLPWAQPCPVPAENELPTEPPMYFCSPHYAAVTELLCTSASTPPSAAGRRR